MIGDWSGPWKVNRGDPVEDRIDATVEIRDRDGRLLLCDTRYYPCALPDDIADLVGAAPELYRILSELRDAFEIYGPATVVEHEQLIQSVNTILAQARGESYQEGDKE